MKILDKRKKKEENCSMGTPCLLAILALLLQNVEAKNECKLESTDTCSVFTLSMGHLNFFFYFSVASDLGLLCCLSLPILRVVTILYLP